MPDNKVPMEETLRPVKVLIVDDSEDDALLMAEELCDGGYAPEWKRVDTPEAMAEALQQQDWDVIIADFMMPRFSGAEALRLLQGTGLDIPFILVSDTVMDHTGVDMMHARASDFVWKNNLSRLPAAVERDIREAGIRRERRRARAAHRESEERFRTIAEAAADIIILADEDYSVLYANPTAERSFGYPASTMLGADLHSLIPGPLPEPRTRDIRIEPDYALRPAEVYGRHCDGHEMVLEVSYSCAIEQGKQVHILVARDITERKRSEQRERELEAHKREFYKRTIRAATEGKLVIAEPDEIAAAAGPVIKSWELAYVDDIASVRNKIRVFAQKFGMEDVRLNTFLGCVTEVAANAIKHAGGGTASLHKHDEILVFVMEDRGPGIEALALPDLALTKGYSTGASLGMGYKIMIEFLDRLYLSTSQEGTIVALEMAVKPISDSISADPDPDR